MTSRTILRVILIILLLTALAAAIAWYTSRSSIAERFIVRALKERGVAHVALKVSEMDTHHAVIENLVIGEPEALRIARAEVTFTVEGLRAGTVKQVDIEGIAARLSETESGPSFGELDALRAEGGTQLVVPVLPFETLRVRDASLTYIPKTGSPMRARIASLEAEHADRAPPILSYRYNALVIEDEQAYTVPLSDTGQVTFDGSRLLAEGKLSDGESRLSIPYSVNQDFATASGEANLAVKPLRFSKKGLQPATLFPFLHDIVNGVDGTFGAEAKFVWSKDTSEQSAVIHIKEGSGTLAGATVTGLSGDVTFSDLSPLATPTKQSLRVAALDIGIPLTDGRVIFAVAPYKKLMLYSTEWSWADGKLRTRPLTLDLAAPKVQKVTLAVDRVALNEALGLFLKDEINATGTISGEIPVWFKNGTLRIEHASLASGASGTIKYTPGEDSPLAKSGNEQTGMLLEALRNFHYKELSLTVNSEDEKNMSVLLSVSGNNPSFYNGKAVNLNIQLQGDLVEIVKQNIDAYNIPKNLEKQLAPHTP